MEQKCDDWQRLERVIEWANMTTNYFARHIGLARGENLYQIKKGSYGISQKTANMIIEKFPEINIVWLLSGKGEMLAAAESSGAAKPLYNLDVEDAIQSIESLKADEQLILPSSINFDLAFRYLGRAMGQRVPTNSIILLKNILPDMIIPGDECVIVSKKIVLLRIAKSIHQNNDRTMIQLSSALPEEFGDITIEMGDIETAYIIKGKILTNR